MKIFFAAFIMLCLIFSLSFPVYTKYLSDFKFDAVENYEFSNISFIENGGIELARDYKEVYSSPFPVWSLAQWKDGFLIGAGDTAQLIYLNKEKNRTIFSSSNRVLVSDIEIMNGDIYLAVIPKAQILILDNDFKLKKTISLSNEYIWNIVPAEKGFYVLTGNPAVLYYFNEQDKMEFSVSLAGEDNLLKGLMVGKELYFTADGNVLYKFDSKNRKIKGVYSFDNSILDFISVKHKIYLITSLSDLKKPAQTQSSEPSTSDDDISTPIKQTSDKKGTRPAVGKSALYSYNPDGTIEKIFEKNNMKFISLSYWDNSLIVGTDKNASYYQVSLQGNVRKLSSLGMGKFARFFTLKGENYALLLEPSRILKILPSFSPQGFVTSSAFDTGNISRWGKPFIGQTVQPKTDIKIYTRSGALSSDDLWDDWELYNNKIDSAPNRYLQYKVELSSDGSKSPLFRNMIIPYIQNNSAPKVEKVTITFNNNSLYKISWDAQDDDKDTLIYNLYLSQADDDWIKINDKPLEDNNFDLNTANYPEGQYRIKVTASDERSNSKEEAKEGYKISDQFVIDNNPPFIGDISIKKSGQLFELEWKVADSLSPIFDVSYSINGLKWIKLLPVDGIYDSLSESFNLKIEINQPSSFEIKAVDIYGNASTKGIFIRK